MSDETTVRLLVEEILADSNEELTAVTKKILAMGDAAGHDEDSEIGVVMRAMRILMANVNNSNTGDDDRKLMVRLIATAFSGRPTVLKGVSIEAFGLIYLHGFENGRAYEQTNGGREVVV